MGVVNTLIPFWLLSWGETRIDSGLASIIQGAVPIFNALLAFAFFRESRVSGLRLVGLAIGFVGVALLVGEQPHGKLLAALAVVAMALCYAIGTLIAGRHLRGTPPLVVALASTAVSTLAVLPVGVIQAPSGMWHGETIMAILVLGLVGTAIAYLLFFALIQRAGPNYATLVTYLVPPIALAYGAIFLGERFGPTAFASLALILVGVALATGGVTRLLAGAVARRAKPGEPAPDPLSRVSVELRRAEPPDVDFLLEVLADDDVRQFLGPRTAATRDDVLAEIERSLAKPVCFGRFVIEVDGEPAGMLGFHVVNERSRIARLERLAIHPGFRGRRLADEAARLFQRLLIEELGYHRLELEIYAFNERACAHAERAGFVREGRKRQAYRKDGEWVDTVLYALIPEDLD